jgi:hypothetical protein
MAVLFPQDRLIHFVTYDFQSGNADFLQTERRKPGRVASTESNADLFKGRLLIKRGDPGDVPGIE